MNKVSSQIVQQMENSTGTALTYSLRVSFFTDVFPLKEIQTISNITDNLNYVAKQQNGNLFDGTQVYVKERLKKRFGFNGI